MDQRTKQEQRWRRRILVIAGLLLVCELLGVNLVRCADARATIALEASPAKISRNGSYRTLPQMIKLFEPGGALDSYIVREHNASLYGGITSIGEYFTRIHIGDQVFRVQVDTGSSTLAIPLAQCRSCLTGDLRYSLQDSPYEHAHVMSCTSSTCGRNTCNARCTNCNNNKCCAEEDPASCGFFLRYGDGSGAQGAMVYDTMRWGGIEVGAYFGGVLRDSRDFEQDGVDGILGLAYKSLACTPTCVDPIFDRMVDEKLVPDIFSICLYEQGGIISLGHYEESSMTSKITWVPMLLSSPPSFYTVEMPGYLGIGGTKVRLQRFRTAIVDSGTTLIVVSERTFIGIQQYLLSAYCHIPGLCSTSTWFMPASCVLMDDSYLELFPTLTFYVGSDNVELKLRPEHYMLPFESGDKTYRCVGIMVSDAIAEVDVILGNTLNMRYVTIYDRQNSRMGFAKRSDNCGVMIDDCETHIRCEQCAAASNCEYDYQTKQCAPKMNEDVAATLRFPYPKCSGNFCFCEFGLGQIVSNAVIGIGMGLLVVSIVLVLGRFAYNQRGRQGYQEIS